MVDRVSDLVQDSESARKRQKMDHTDDNVDQKKPIYLKLNFKRAASPTEDEAPDPLIEDDDTYSRRPWQETTTDVPVLLAFRTQFNELFDGVPELGPQDIEEGISSTEPGPDVMRYVCRLLTLALNRIKPVEYA